MTQGLAQEIHKKNPFDVPEEEAFLNVMRTHSILSNVVERFLRPYDLSFATYNALRILRAAGKDGKTCSSVGVDMVARVPDVTRLMDRLERQGLVKRAREREDRRVVRVLVTDQGLALLDKVDKPLIELQRGLLGHLPKPELETMSQLLYKTRHKPGEKKTETGY
jgi:DNA-binding MarR family transcriptional regulator